MSKNKKAVKSGNKRSTKIVKTPTKSQREVVKIIPETQTLQSAQQLQSTTQQDNQTQQSMHPHHKKVYVWAGIGLLLVILFIIFLNMNKTGDVAGKATAALDMYEKSCSIDLDCKSLTLVCKKDGNSLNGKCIKDEPYFSGEIYVNNNKELIGKIKLEGYPSFKDKDLFKQDFKDSPNDLSGKFFYGYAPYLKRILVLGVGGKYVNGLPSGSYGTQKEDADKEYIDFSCIEGDSIYTTDLDKYESILKSHLSGVLSTEVSKKYQTQYLSSVLSNYNQMFDEYYKDKPKPVSKETICTFKQKLDQFKGDQLEIVFNYNLKQDSLTLDKYGYANSFSDFAGPKFKTIKVILSPDSKYYFNSEYTIDGKLKGKSSTMMKKDYSSSINKLEYYGKNNKPVADFTYSKKQQQNPQGSANQIVDTSIYANNVVTFKAKASDADMGDKLSYGWYISNKKVSTEKEALTGNFEYTFAKSGKYKIGLSVSDGKDIVKVSKEIIVKDVVKGADLMVKDTKKLDVKDAKIEKPAVQTKELIHPQPPIDSFTLACKDTDPLQNPYLEGAVFIGSNPEKDTCNRDEAANTDKLTQYFCDVKTAGIKLGSETTVCEFGCHKTEGRCLTEKEKPKPIECKQTPALQSPYCGTGIKKNVLYKPYYSTEKNGLGNCKIKNNLETCSLGCKEGKCLEKS
ncbi:PKD domain-containing protein, partial [Candidatus Woesearchaeota archaeon]|nr:PKD domain-containing protein [Candidatus Woesearchaeota archaeon]